MGSAQSRLPTGPTLHMEHILPEEAQDFECPICLQALEKPIKTQCGHVFCEECHSRNFQLNDGKCPLCRKTTSRVEQHATDVLMQMMTKQAKCSGCDVEVCLINMRTHTKSCSRYLEECGPAPDANTLPQPTPAAHRPMEANPWAYTCPYCQERDYNQEDLITHCSAHHYDDRRRVVCPICASMPWGDSGYYSRNFMAHLNLRHQFEYENFVDFSQDEVLMMQDTIFNSYQHFAQIPF
ncbi:E3 ubiquitin-protein ligase RNF114 [Scyliorhinus torazame]|uniref:E3 ubiquitin-protein ligase RNF114 n=1 Tax=Scyliorhinus torazame TaxID=75743 RepID=UPI003B5910A2